MDAVEARLGGAPGSVAERLDRLLDLLRRGLGDLAARHHVGPRGRRQRLDVGQEGLAAGVGDLREHFPAMAVDGVRHP
jgi:hypothetical protein